MASTQTQKVLNDLSCLLCVQALHELLFLLVAYAEGNKLRKSRKKKQKTSDIQETQEWEWETKGNGRTDR